MTIQGSKCVRDLWVIRKKPEQVCQGETRRQASRCRWRILSRRAGGTRACCCCCETKWCKPWLGVWAWSEGETERDWRLEKESKEERPEGDWYEALSLICVCICSFVKCVRFNYGDQIDSELDILMCFSVSFFFFSCFLLVSFILKLKFYKNIAWNQMFTSTISWFHIRFFWRG